MQSAKLQYIVPDEDLTGKKNKGIIQQYPYFAPDRGHMKKAPKMTKADELYLKKFMAARAHKDVAKVEDTLIAPKQYVNMNPNDSSMDSKQLDGPINVEIDTNSRLFLERNRKFKPE
jgi:hypothetical protein